VAVRKVTPDEFATSAKPVLDRLVKTFDWKEGPFRRDLNERLILDLLGFWLDEEQFRAICEAARSVGDTNLLYSNTRGYLGGPELMPYYTWELSLFEYDEYCDSDDEPVNREHDIGIPLDRVLYSPSGKWAVVLPDELALVGGSHRFMDSFKRAYPQWTTQMDLFVAARLDAARKRGANMAWVPQLLQHVYGDDAPPFVP